MKRELLEPCLDRNPYAGAAWGCTTENCPPCGRPRGHPNSGGGGGSSWGRGHSSDPGRKDPPTKKLVLVPAHWEVER